MVYKFAKTCYDILARRGGGGGGGGGVFFVFVNFFL